MIREDKAALSGKIKLHQHSSNFSIVFFQDFYPLLLRRDVYHIISRREHRSKSSDYVSFFSNQ